MMKIVGGCFLALALTLTYSTRPISAVAPPGPGFSMVYGMELRSEGRISRESLTLTLGGETDLGQRRIELVLGDGDLRYRAEYRDRGEDSPFAAERFSDLHRWEGEWVPLSPDDSELLRDMREMAMQLSGETWDAESTFVVGGRELPCKRYTFSSGGEQVQGGESVRIRIVQSVQGEVWVCPELPFGGWVQYHEERRARKISELGGRIFQGDEEVSDERWTLKDLAFPGESPD